MIRPLAVHVVKVPRFFVLQLMGLLSFFGFAKSQPATPSPSSVEPTSSEFDKALVSLKINNDTALFILLADDGTVNRLGNGAVNNTDQDMYIGRNSEPLFKRFIARITPEMLRHQGGYELANRKGAECELTIMLGYRGKEGTAGFKFLYGSESKGPPQEIAELVRYAIELTGSWHHEQKRIAAKK